eukprot:scaffold481421_cov27-Prasinocladus_malaysianus.AAC.1
MATRDLVRTTSTVNRYGLQSCACITRPWLLSYHTPGSSSTRSEYAPASRSAPCETRRVGLLVPVT